jgi:hypothetical protein
MPRVRCAGWRDEWELDGCATVCIKGHLDHDGASVASPVRKKFDLRQVCRDGPIRQILIWINFIVDQNHYPVPR